MDPKQQHSDRFNGDKTFTANWTANATYYTVTFVDYDGTVLDTDTVISGGDAAHRQIRQETAMISLVGTELTQT
jgi:hypothetical protein